MAGKGIAGTLIGYHAAMTSSTRLACSLVLLLYGAVAWSHLGGLRWDSDEGINWAKGRLVADTWSGQGDDRLYGTIWSDQPPLYTLLSARPIALAGIPGARAVTVGLSLLGLLGTALAASALARAIGLGPAPAAAAPIAAMVLLSVAPNFWWASRAAMIGLPAFSLASLAMGLLFWYGLQGRRRDLVLGAAALGLSLLTKLQMAYLGPIAAGFLLVQTWRSRRRRAEDLALLAVLGLGPLLVAAAVFGPAPFWSQVFGSYQATRNHFQPQVGANVGVLMTWLGADHRELAVLCAVGLAGGLLAVRRQGGRSDGARGAWLLGAAYLAWLLLTVLTPLQHAPLWIKDHFLPLLLALAPGAGIGVALALDYWTAARPTDLPARPARPLGTWFALANQAVVLAYLAALPRLLRLDEELSRARSYDNDGLVAAPGDDAWRSLQRKEDAIRAAALWLRARTAQDAFVATDHQLVAAWAGRRVTPAFAAYSSRAVGIGAFDEATVASGLARQAPAAVLLWDADIAGSTALHRWLDDRCVPDADFGMERLGFLCDQAAGGQAGVPAGPLPAFATAELLGWVAETHGLEALQPDGRRSANRVLDLRLFWRAERPSPRPLSVSVHLLAADGQRVAQHDGTPAEGGRPTDEWLPGEVVVDRHLLELPVVSSPQALRARIGLYDPETGSREQLTRPGEPSSALTDAIDLALPVTPAGFRFDPLEDAP